MQLFKWGHYMEDDPEESTQECEDPTFRNYSVLLHKGFSNQGAIGGY